MKQIAILRYKKNGEIDFLRGRNGTFIGGCGVSHIQVPLQKALAMTHGDRFFSVDAEHFSDVITVYLKICYYSQLMETLERHQ